MFRCRSISLCSTKVTSRTTWTLSSPSLSQLLSLFLLLYCSLFSSSSASSHPVYSPFFFIFPPPLSLYPPPPQSLNTFQLLSISLSICILFFIPLSSSPTFLLHLYSLLYPLQPRHTALHELVTTFKVLKVCGAVAPPATWQRISGWRWMNEWWMDEWWLNGWMMNG